MPRWRRSGARRRNDPKHRSNPEAAFRFFRENGIKTLLTIEARSDEAAFVQGYGVDLSF